MQVYVYIHIYPVHLWWGGGGGAQGAIGFDSSLISAITYSFQLGGCG